MAEVPEVEVGEFDILLPDSTGFFASWYGVAAESVPAFVIGEQFGNGAGVYI